MKEQLSDLISKKQLPIKKTTCVTVCDTGRNHYYKIDLECKNCCDQYL